MSETNRPKRVITVKLDPAKKTLTVTKPAPLRTGEWSNSFDVSIKRVWEHKRRNLIFIRLGSAKYENLPLPEIRDYDIALNYFDKPENPELGEIVIAGGLSKFHAAKKFFEAHPDRLEHYDSVYFLDADVKPRFDIEEFILFCETHNFDLAQASLSSDSQSGWTLTRNCPPFVYRMTNFVECMAPWFSRTYLQQMLHTFDWSYSAWGLDFIWGHNTRNAAVVDKFQMYHPWSENNPFPYLMREGIDPRAEYQWCLNKLGMNSYQLRTFEFLLHEEWSS